MIKAQILLENDFARAVKDIGQVKYLALTGQFIGRKDIATDLLLIGKVNRVKFNRLLKKFQEYFDHDINYTLMTMKEYEYRRQLTDRFLFNVLENKKIIVVDHLPKPKSN